MFYGQNIANPLESMNNSLNNRDNEGRLIASGNVLITFLPGFTFKTMLSLDRRNGHETGYNNINLYYNEYGNAWDNRNTNQLLVWDNVLTYKEDIKKHGIEAMLGSSWTKSSWSQSWINGSSYYNDIIHTLNAANRIIWDNTGTYASEWAIMSYFGRFNYKFDERYLFTANVRIDGSSKLHPKHRWGIFPSFAAAWRISQEDFLKDVRWIDNLKLRANWGQTGNQSGIGDYGYMMLYDIIRSPWFDGALNVPPSITRAQNLPTPDLTWETTSQTDIGLEWGLFNRLTFEIDYYYKWTTNMLMNVSLFTGPGEASNIYRNEGVMRNSGVEFSINSRNIIGKFEWNTNFNMSFNRNKLISLQLKQIYDDGRTNAYALQDIPIVRNEPGHSLGGFWGYISNGVDPETGDLMYSDLNHDGKINPNDKTFIGNPNPDFIFGMTNILKYWNFTLSIFLQGTYGNDIFNASKGDLEGMYDLQNQSTKVLERWRVPGQITDVPRAGFTIKPSTWFVEDGSYLRVKDLTLAYDFNSKLLKKARIRKIQPYFTCQNLLTWTKYLGMDPEVNQWGNSGAVQGIDWGTYPHSRTFVLGVNVEF
jgi:TonB-linked SusC/RagA family outer membrane protein